MNRMLKGFFSLALLTCAAVFANNEACKGTPYFNIRSQSVNAARELAGWQPHINLFDKDCFYGSFTITPEFTRSFRPGRLAEFLFGQDLQEVNGESGSLVISGSQAANRGAKDWLGDYFGLPTDFKSVVTFKPRITNFLVDFNLYLGLDEWAQGLYFRIHAPVVWSRWELRASETFLNPGSLYYANGYMNNGGDVTLNGGGAVTAGAVGVANSALSKSWLGAMDGSYTFGDMKTPLAFGKISGGSIDGSDAYAKSKHTKTALSDIEAALGWNFWQCEDYHFGLQIRGAAPTGTRPNGEYLFEPTVGNGKHWELGGAVSAHAILWRGCDEDRYFGVWMDANITHLFKTKQTRSFDFVGKPNSRYMLLEEMTSTVNDLLVGLNPAMATAPNAQYAGNLLPAINLTTLDVNVSIAVQGDFVLKFAYVSDCFEADLGYNLWGRSGEKFSLKNEPAITEKKYALKGASYVYGFPTAVGATVSAIALSATNSGATIHGGTDPIDNRFDAFNNAATQLDAPTPPTLAVPNPTTVVPSNSSNPAVFVTSADIDLSKTPSALSNKVFGSLSYTWNDCECWVPFLGLGAEVEFGSNRGDNCQSAVSQWGIWLKGGLDFN